MRATEVLAPGRSGGVPAPVRAQPQPQPVQLPAHVLELQRGAGNRAVTGLLQRVGTKQTPSQFNAIVGVSDHLLDEGSKLLKNINRPAVVNDARADKLSNCAMTTLAAIEGNRTSGGTVKRMREELGVTTHSTGDQSQRVWAMTLEDVDTLAAAKLALPADQRGARTLTADDETRSQSTTKALEDFPEGNAYVVGDAQYYGMLQYLSRYATASSTADVTFKVYECGEPGNVMFDEPGTLTKMNACPNGTRFAVFLYSSDVTQHVRAHWVYAERFNGQVIFRDFQTNVPGLGGGTPKEVGTYLAGFPFSPESRDKGKSFSQGCFIALVPFFANAPAPTVPGKPVDKAGAEAILAQVKTKRRALATPIETTGEKMPTSWPPLRPGGALTEIPAPGVVDATLKKLVGDFGVTPVCKFGALDKKGVVKLIGAPTHASTKVQKDVRLPSGDRTKVNVATDEITFPNVSSTINVVEPTKAAAPDPNLGGGSAAQKEDRYVNAAAVAYQISAQNTAEGIVINATNAEFTDLIHEGTHAFEQTAAPMHFREGLCEIFASMAAQRLAVADVGFSRFGFAYNPTYAAYTVAMQNLVAVMGLAPLARAYFGPASTFRDSLRTELQAVASAANVDAIADKLLSPDFPRDFRQGLSDLTTAGAAPGATSAPLAGEYGTRTTGFNQYLDDQVKAYEKQYGKKFTGADQQAKGDYVQMYGGLDTAEKRLKMFYLHRSEVSGGQFVELMKLIELHEKDVMAATGETKAVMRKRLLPAIRITFRTHYNTKPGEDIYVGGEDEELGAWNTGKAVKLNHRDGGVWAGDVTMPRTGGSVVYKYLLKTGASSQWETPNVGEHHERVMPSNADTVEFADNWGNVRGA